MADNAEIKATEIKPPASNPHNIEATKYYIFNQTGNIMMSSTIDSNTPISEDVQKIFSEVSVFFAGMSRAMSTTKNPATGKPYSLYNYAALESVIKGSGLFVHVTEEDVTHSSKSGGATFSKELIESLLGLATGLGGLAFASSMISSIGQEGLNISASQDKTNSKVGNIVFVCEYLLGMPSISAIVVYADMAKNEVAFKAGPCIKGHSSSVTLTMHKDTYMFVTPTFIHEYAGDLGSINSDPQYLAMINWLGGLLLRTPTIFNVADRGNGYASVDSGSALVAGHSYALQGQFLPTDKVSLKWASGATTSTFSEPNYTGDQIAFTVNGTMDDESAINVVLTDGGKDTVVASSPGSFTVTSGT
ncbi:hypothetical protein A1OO_16375 [Enterovibrio norvegicus FF-33]|uniref:Uncharacterized protein n=1 Tax=Enterovibrio norvegicus FF-454 TaxID=1185651 RepID=A0A1E5BW18_9GAMM|nr:hypothetical protein [Enterovibrio norvegicus]OEE57405.1 hypothetical protein A1OK_17420 [Enterovibrio norvegicus FF-454]OEE67328.1 hypothetical protein A1OO_16375 [Enterovibrio norvegicus FF-33]OEE73963.1 hypothetical protein A1OQ_10330 [Enterovibrio norvegicus FF-162]